MADTFTKVTTQSWGSRLSSSIKSVLTGFVFFLGSFVLLWWNEGNSVRTAKGLEEGAGLVVSIESTSVVPENEGKLVHLSGDIKTEEFLDDPDFNIHVNALKLNRNISMYQWTEEEKSTEEKKVGGETQTVTTYTYKQEWSDDLINSSDFAQPEGHSNPSDFAIQGRQQSVARATLGAFVLSPSLINRNSDFRAYPISAVDTIKFKGAKLVGDGIYMGKGSVSSPQIGDIKISFSTVNPGTVSIVARQIKDSFEEYTTSTGTSIELLSQGQVSAEKMFADAQAANTLLTWILRLVGFILMFAGLAMIFKPLVVVADVLPFLGNLLGMGVSIFALAVSLLLSFITIALAWIYYRPILGILLLAAGTGIFILIYRAVKKKKISQQPVEAGPNVRT